MNLKASSSREDIAAIGKIPDEKLSSEYGCTEGISNPDILQSPVDKRVHLAVSEYGYNATFDPMDDPEEAFAVFTNSAEGFPAE